jgi:hypothetical protein
MSNLATTWAWQQATGSSGQRLVLLALADACGGDEDDPRICWPSVTRIAKMVDLSDSVVRKHMESLVLLGLISKVERRRRRDGSLGTWTITVNFTTAHPRAVGDEATAHPQAVDHRSPTGALEPSYSEPPESTSRAIALVDDGFDDFWSLYPRHEGKPAAKKAWARLSKADQTRAWLSLPLWLPYWDEHGFIPYAQKWINQRFFDAAIPTVKAKRTAGINGMGLPPEMVDLLNNTRQLPSIAELRARRDEADRKELNS